MILSALAIKLIVLWQLHDHPLLQPTATLDDGAYVGLAKRVVGGDWALGPDVYYLSPLYAYFVALVFALSDNSLSAVRAVQAVLGTVSVGLVYSMAREWAGTRAALIAGSLAALTGLLAFHEVLILQAAIDPFLTALALYLLARALQGARWTWAVAAGAALGLLVLNRPNVLPFASLAAVGLFWQAAPKARLKSAGAFLAGLVLIIAPVTVRNRVVAGEWVLVSSHGGLNFYIGNHPEADGTYTAIPGVIPSIEGQTRDTRLMAEREAGRPLSTSEVSGYFYRRSWAWMRERPGDAIGLMGRKILLLLNAADLPLNYSYTYYSRDEATILRALIVGPWLLLPVGLVGAFVMGIRVRRGPYAVWVSFIPVYGLSVALFFVSTRYRLPLLIPLCVTAAGFVTWAAGQARARQWRVLALAGLGLAAAATVTNWNIGPDVGRINERAEMAVYLAAAGRVEESKAMLARLEGPHATSGIVYFRVGQALWQRGLADEAVGFLERALELDTEQPDIRLALGQALLAAGRAADAVPHLAAAKAAGVGPAAATTGLGRAFAALGRRDDARAALAEFVDLAPPDADADTWLNAGLLALSLGDAVLAERALRQALPGAGSLAHVHEHLGVALLLQGRSASAIPEFERACALDASGASARYNLAVALAREGRVVEARARVEEALRLRADYPQARQMLDTLRALK